MENIDNNEMELNEINEGEEVQNTEAENDFLKSLDDEARNDDPTSPINDDSMLLEQGKITASAMLVFGEGLIKQFGHKDFAFDQSQAEGVANSAAPLFVKYGGELPPWLLQYKEELLFAFAAGTLCFSSVRTVKELKQADLPKEPEKVDGATEDKEQLTNAAH